MPPPPASGDLNSDPERPGIILISVIEHIRNAGHRTASVCTKFEVRIGLPVPKVWLVFGDLNL